MMTELKITDLDSLAGIISQARDAGRRVVHCHGVFDLLHIGHIRYFEQAKQMGDILVVTLTPDRYVDKGPHRPAFNEDLRAEAVASLNVVDYVAINLWATAEQTLRQLRPDVYVKGSEFKDIASDRTGKIALEKAVIDEIGSELAFAEDIVFSSSSLINRYLSNLPREINNYLEIFRKRYTLEETLSLLDRMGSVNVLVVGDTILDEYQYCDTIGKSTKDPALALHYRSHDMFAGGVLAVANHVANLAGEVTLVTSLGEHDRHEQFIRAQLNSRVTPIFYTQANAPTIVKRRYLDGYSFNKLFEVYVMDDAGLDKATDERLCRWVQENAGHYDLVIAADFGHGAVSRQLAETLQAAAPFLAVNTQANAGNRGMHTISKYARADFASMARHELRLECGSDEGTLREQMLRISNRMGCAQLIITLGRKGCAVCGPEGGFIKVPSFARQIVDRVGAGDALFSVTSLAAVLNAPHELSGFIGNVAGALAVEELGNKKSVKKEKLEKFVTSLMK
jgi:rfaE bifunctional protein kinase chain/domain/rfaE bifunctional protein nucleotidyltransferase chain/domain